MTESAIRDERYWRDQFAALRLEIGGKCHLSPGFTVIGREGAVQSYVAPFGIGTGLPSFFVYADTWGELVEAVRAKWEEMADLHTARRVRAIALKIIEITADQGECTDASLRAADIDQRDIDQFGERAIAEANSMADRGPFDIVRVAGSNAEAA